MAHFSLFRSGIFTLKAIFTVIIFVVKGNHLNEKPKLSCNSIYNQPMQACCLFFYEGIIFQVEAAFAAPTRSRLKRDHKYCTDLRSINFRFMCKLGSHYVDGL